MGTAADRVYAGAGEPSLQAGSRCFSSGYPSSPLPRLRQLINHSRRLRYNFIEIFLLVVFDKPLIIGQQYHIAGLHQFQRIFGKDPYRCVFLTDRCQILLHLL